MRDSVTSIGGSAFYGCSNLTSVTIGNSVTTIGNNAFYGCNALTNITIPDSVTSIGGSAFYCCTCIIQTENGVHYVDKWVVDCDTSITGVSFRVDTKGIANYSFSGCDSLKYITIPDGVTSIGDGAFYNCSSLRSITIPDGVTSIGSEAFNGCGRLTNITFKGIKEQWNAIKKGSNWDLSTGNYTIKCTDGEITKN